MHVFTAIILTVLPGSWLIVGLRPSGLPSHTLFPIAIALSPAVVGLQLAVLEAAGLPFAVSAIVLVLLNLPCAALLIRWYRTQPVTPAARSWLPCLLLLALLITIPVLLWSLIPGLRTYTWSAMLQTDVVYTIARNGVNVEEANLAGVTLAYGWIGHSYWSLIGWLGGWAPTVLYPFSNIVWLVVMVMLTYELGTSGLGLHQAAALLGVALTFLATNVLGISLLVATGYSDWWERHFGDIRYSPLLSKFYAFDTMLWGMALLAALALVYSIALRRRVIPLGGISFALLVALALVYPILFPAGIIVAGCFLFLTLTGVSPSPPLYTRGEWVRIAFAVVLSILAGAVYLALITVDREVVTFSRSNRTDFTLKSIRFLTALGPFLLLAALPFSTAIRRRRTPALLLGLSSLVLCAAYMAVNLAQLEYKYILAATICLAPLAAAAVDPLFRRHARLGWACAATAAAGLAAINLLLVFQAGAHIPGNLNQAAQIDESSFHISLHPSDPNAAWTTAIRKRTPENTVVMAQVPGVHLSALVSRSMYVPSDLEGGQVPGYNLNQRFYLLRQRGYSTPLYDSRLEMMEALFQAQDETRLSAALHSLKTLQRPVAIYFPDRTAWSPRWLEAHTLGRSLTSDDRSTVWLIDDPDTLP